LTDEFPEKSWTKHGVNKMLKKLWNTGTVVIATKRSHKTTGSFQATHILPKKITMPLNA